MKIIQQFNLGTKTIYIVYIRVYICVVCPPSENAINYSYYQSQGAGPRPPHIIFWIQWNIYLYIYFFLIYLRWTLSEYKISKLWRCPCIDRHRMSSKTSIPLYLYRILFGVSTIYVVFEHIQTIWMIQSELNEEC